jgi:hypothetical protein
MTDIRCEVQHYLPSEAPVDWAVHSVYHHNDAVPILQPVDWQNHVNEVLSVFKGQATGHTSAFNYLHRNIRVAAYDMADPKPRPEKAVALWTATAPDPVSTYGPHQVAIRCSWYCGRNIRGKRGGIYVGPLSGGDTGVHLVGSTTVNAVLELGHALWDVGGANVYHILWHEASHSGEAITDYWVDNSFDIIRRRKEKATSRVTVHP